MSSRLAALVACSAAVLCCLWAPAGAGALSQRGHAFGFSFGGEGEGAGQFRFGGAFKLSEAAGVAVDEATGDVYVVDRGNERVEEFQPRVGSGGEVVGEEFVSAWGWGVLDGKDEYEMCTSTCESGVAGPGKGELKEAGPIAVDNSPGGSGTVYLGANGSAKKPNVQRFTADGDEALGKLPVEEEGRLEGVAVDRHGTAWLYRGEEEEEGVIEGFTGGKPPVLMEPTLASPLECPKPGFAVDAGGEDFYVSHELLDGGGECPAVVDREFPEEAVPLRPSVAGVLNAAQVEAGGEATLGELDRQNTTAIAVDQASGTGTPLGMAAEGDVYVDDGMRVAVFSADGTPVQSFGSGELQEGMGVAVDAKNGDVFVVEGASDKVDVFVPEAARQPSVDALEAHDLSPSEATLSAQVNPDGADTHYYFQFGTVNCAERPSECSDVPVAPGTDIGAGFGAQSVSTTVRGLVPSTTYFYRVLASNSLGQAEGAQTLGSFSTLSGSRGLLADDRAWELVSPAEKDGASVEALSRENGLVQAAADGGAVTYVTTGPVVSEPEGNRAPEANQVLSTRSPEGWASQDLAIPREKGEGLEAGEPPAYRFFSEDLALSLVQPAMNRSEPLEAPPLAPGASEKTLYVRDDPPLAPSEGEQALYAEAQANSGFLAPGYRPLVTPADVTAEAKPGEKEAFGGKLDFLDTTPDLTHVVFESEAPLLSGLAGGLYEWSAGALELVSVLPDGQGGISPTLGQENTDLRGAVSNDGSRVFFGVEGEEGAPDAVYMRDTNRHATLDISAAQGVAEPTAEESEVAFQAATPDGSRVFFTDTAPLTPESTQRPRPESGEGDLYECEVHEEHGAPACSLKDLTPVSTGGSADVLNMIPGISEDGSYVYFVANGVLAPGAAQGDCVHQSLEVAPAGATCNLYVWHEGAITFIGALSNEDSGDWGSLHGSGRTGEVLGNRPDLADVTSRVSPNGRYLAFMSNMPLTGYETLDAAHPGVHDEEVYLYDAATRQLTCASCDPQSPPVGVHDTTASGEGQGLVVDRREDWAGQYLAGSVPGWTAQGVDRANHQPRYLSDSGRLFFDSPDDLVHQAVNGKEDVYEYEPDTVATCTQQEGCVSLISAGTSQHESAFLEADETGKNVYFITEEPLVPADHDTNYDLYDARVCSNESPCLVSEQSSVSPCESTASCKPDTTPRPVFATPPTGSAQSTGNTGPSPAPPPSKPAPKKPKPLTRAQKLTRALKACRRDKHHARRLACERVARRRYGSQAKHASKHQPTSRTDH